MLSVSVKHKYRNCGERILVTAKVKRCEKEQVREKHTKKQERKERNVKGAWTYIEVTGETVL